MNRIPAIILALLFFWLSLPVSAASDLTPDKEYYGFKLIEKRQITDVNATAYLFEHSISGARLFKMAVMDDNKLFSITFRTPPTDNSGIAHILEHAVLHGSKNFPVKDAGPILDKTSLKTFLNAMTSFDFTSFPVASRNDDDFKNLMHVYLDAAFYPLIYQNPMILLQEGWHYEINPQDASLVYNGVVYNEMKENFSPERMLTSATYHALFPDNHYRFESGGIPSDIPTVTQARLEAFHRKHYVPNNSLIFIYGNGDTLAELKFIHENYLTNFREKGERTTFPLQRPLTKAQLVSERYPSAATSDDQTQLAYAVAINRPTREDALALDVLSIALLESATSPLRKALMSAGIGQDYDTLLNHNLQSVFSLIAKNARSGDRDRFIQVVERTLKGLVKNGFDRTLTENAIDKLEFQLREADYEQKGLYYAFKVNMDWLYSDNPFRRLTYASEIESIRRKIRNGYLQQLTRQYLLDNPHKAIISMAPDKDLLLKIEGEEKKRLAAIRKNLTDDEFKTITQEAQALKVYQTTPDKPEDVATIPQLSRRQLDKNAVFYEARRDRLRDMDLLYYPAALNQIVYLNLYFNAQTVLPDQAAYLALLSYLLGQTATARHTYDQLSAKVNAQAVELEGSLLVLRPEAQPTEPLPYFVLSAKVLRRKLPLLLATAREILCQSRFTDSARLRTLLQRHRAQLQAQIRNDPREFAINRLDSRFTNNAKFREDVRGFSYYQFIDHLVKNFDRENVKLSRTLKILTKQLFNRGNLLAAVAASEDEYASARDNLDMFAKQLPKVNPQRYQFRYQLTAENEAIVGPTQVQNVIQGGSFRKLGYPYNGKLLVLGRLLDTDYMQKNVRAIGGAYAVDVDFGTDGVFFLASGRDPNLSATLERYRAIPSYLASLSLSDRELDGLIISTIATLDAPRTPRAGAIKAFENALKGRTRSIVQKERDEVLTTDLQDLKSQAEMIKKVLDEQNIFVYGGDQAIRGEKGVFKSIHRLDL